MAKNILDIGISFKNWFAVEHSKNLGINKPISITIWDKDFLLYRDEAGKVHALDNRCPHRKLPLHIGSIENGCLTCVYHGWQFDTKGKLKNIPFWPQGKKLPEISIRTYLTQEKNGLIWIFPENYDINNEQNIPDSSLFETQEWLSFSLDQTFENHHALGMINGMDFFHFHLHKKYQQWKHIEITDFKKDSNNVFGEYKILLQKNWYSNIFKFIQGLPRSSIQEQYIRIHYQYPYQFTEIDDHFKIWVYATPITRNKVKVFIKIYIRAPNVWSRLNIRLRNLISKNVMKKIQKQDHWICMHEHNAWEKYPHQACFETNPISAATQQMIVSKWEEYLESSIAAKKEFTAPNVSAIDCVIDC